MTTSVLNLQGSAAFFDPNLIRFREHEMGLLLDYAVQKVIRDLVVLYAREINLRRDGRLPASLKRGSVLSGRDNDSKEVWKRREWMTCAEVMLVYGFSRYTVRKIVKDSKEKNIEVQVAILSFHHGTPSQRTRPFILINKRSLDAYLAAHCDAQGGGEARCGGEG
ncbi:hypothetical protein AC781_08765 [Akkermansia glycaniphila]|nr:hypothetical protein AC781_08765 [Akkermansia glycaniphila]